MERYGWICSRCSASNSPDEHQCRSLACVNPRSPVKDFGLLTCATPGCVLSFQHDKISCTSGVRCPLKGCDRRDPHLHGETP